MMAISVDRYFTVKNYRPIGQVATRRQVMSIAVAATWLSAAVLASLQIISRFKHPWKKGLMIGRITMVHIIPACTVMLSHLGVHAKLTALSLTARAKHGELPLPIPLIRRPTHVIIVAGMPKVRIYVRPGLCSIYVVAGYQTTCSSMLCYKILIYFGLTSPQKEHAVYF